jgi:hypothetical protein
MGTAIGAVIDYLLAQLQPLVVAVVPDALVIDTVNRGSRSANMLWLAREDIDEGAQATPLVGRRTHPLASRSTIDEAWELPCLIDCRADGVAQTLSRTPALALFDVVAHLVATDPTLGGLLTQAKYADIPSAELRQPEGTTTAQSRSLVRFTVGVKRRYQA